MKKPLLLKLVLFISLFFFWSCNHHDSKSEIEEDFKLIKKKKKTPEERVLFSEERAKYEYELQRNPTTGEIPIEEKALEFENSKKAKVRPVSGRDNLRAADASFINRGPSNLGGRARSVVVDISDATGNTMLAGGVSSGVFRTTDGGASWTKVSANNEIHNVTSIVQDPRVGHQNKWYYSTGELLGNSAGIGNDVFNINSNSYLGRGIWQSTDGGLTWSQFTGTNSTQEVFDTTFDYISKLAVDPTTGYLFAAVVGQVLFYLPAGAAPPNPAGWYLLAGVTSCCSTTQMTDVAITSTGRIYAAIGGGGANAGVWATNSIFSAATKLTSTPVPPRRIVISIAPSNENKVYALIDNGTSSDCAGTAAPEADLWMWNQSGTSWTNYSTKLPDETGCSNGNDPFAVQGGYDLSISVKPDDEDFVVIGGTNAYRIADIVNDASFVRIGGYKTATSYSLWDYGGTEHHPDIHDLVFSPFDSSVLFTGSDGGVHKTTDVSALLVNWTNLNNNFQTQQYYHVAIDPQSGSDFVLGGLQDNGTNQGGTLQGFGDLSTQGRIWGGDGVAVGISRDNASVPTFVGFQNGPIYRRNKDLAPNFFNALITPSGSSSQFVTYFHLDQDNNKNLYYAGLGVLYRTTDATNVTTNVGAGATDWSNMGTPTGVGNISRLNTTWGTYNASTSYLLIGGNGGKVFRLNDPQNAANVSGAVDITPAGATGVVTGLAIHPTNRDIVLLTYSNYGITNIYRTTNATAATPTWVNVERNLSSHSIRSAAIVEANGDTMYLVGTARGLYSSLDPTSQDWIREAPNLIGFAVVSSMAYRPADGKLLIGTHGNGMFEATITQVLGLEENEFSQNLKIYPNPVSDVLNVELTDYLGARPSFRIYNLLGQNVSQGELKDERIDVSNLNNGLYFLEVTSEGKRGVKRFIKQ